jgi:hypothetical protein
MSKPPLNDVEGDFLLTGFHRERKPERHPVQSCIIVSPPRAISEFERAGSGNLDRSIGGFSA